MSVRAVAARTLLRSSNGRCVRRLGRAFVHTKPPSAADSTDSTTTGVGSRPGLSLAPIVDHMLPTSQKASGHFFQHTKHPKTVSLIGAPMTYGQPFVGTDSGPRLLRDAGLRGMLTSLGWRVEELPDLDFDRLVMEQQQDSANDTGTTHDDPHTKVTAEPINAKNSEIVGAGAWHLANMVEEKLHKGYFPLVLGGDHSVALGSLAGILRARPHTGVLWIDAHADLNTPETSGSGNLHGMPLGLLVDGVDSNAGHRTIPGLEWLAAPGAPRLPPEALVYIGLRDVDPGERAAIRKLGIAAYTMYDVDHYGIGTVMDMALQHLLKDDPHRPLHLSYDIDAVDPLHAPATGTAVRGGLTFREAHFVAEFAAQSGNLASADIVELNPSLSDGAGARDTVDLGLQIVTSFMGKSII